MKKILTIILTLLLTLSSVFVFTACGGNDSGKDDGKVTIYVVDKTDGKAGMNKWLKNKQDAFAKAHPEIVVEHKTNPTTDPKENVQAVINNLNIQETAYTILVTNNNTYARTVYNAGVTEDWTKYLSNETLSLYNQEVLSGYTANDGALVGIPNTLELPLLGFNRKILQSTQVKINLGIDPSASDANNQVEQIIDNIKTWDDFLQVAKKLSGTYKVSGDERNVSGYGGYLTDYYIGLGVWNVANGYTTTKQNKDGTIDYDLTNTETVETIEFLRKLKSEGALTHDANLGYQDFFNKIFSYQIASFIYYPSWADSWFEPNGIYASDIKVINLPYGPSVERKMESKKTDNTVVVPKTNTCFSIGFVLNKRASEAQKKAAAVYIEYMYGKSAWEDRIDYAKDSGLPVVNVPAFNFSTEYMKNEIFANIPNDWVKALENSVQSSFSFDLNSDGFIDYLYSATPDLVANSKYSTREAIIQQLGVLNSRIENEFFKDYNEQYKK